MLRDLMMLVWPGGHSGLFAHRRAQAAAARVRGIATLFAVLTMAWIPVDAAVFGAPLWHKLAAVRMGAAAALSALALSCAVAAPTRAQAAVRVEALFAIPAAFFFASLAILHDAPRDGLSGGVAAAYSFMPFMLAAGIAAFPLTILESFLLASFALIAQAWALQAGRSPLLALDTLPSLWLLFLVAAVAGFAAASQLKLLRALVEQAIRDPLTGCLRRESGIEILEAQLMLATRHHTSLTVLFADIDRFKSVNDEFGHEAGDRVLAGAAAALRASLRESDVLVRWGGEEFVAILPHASRREAWGLVERMSARGFGRLPDDRGITLSIGAAEFPADAAVRGVDLVALADARMYAAKQAGRDRYVDGVSEARPILRAPAPSAAAPPAVPRSTASR